MGLTCIYKHWLSCIVKLIWEMTPRWQENFHICLSAAMGWMQRWTKHWSSKLRVIQKKLGMDKGTLRVLQVLTIKFWVKGTKATEVDIGFLWTSSSSGQMFKSVWVSGWITRSGPNKLHSRKVTISLQTTTKMYVGSLNQLYVIINWATLCKPLNPCHLFPWGKSEAWGPWTFRSVSIQSAWVCEEDTKIACSVRPEEADVSATGNTCKKN